MTMLSRTTSARHPSFDAVRMARSDDTGWRRPARAIAAWFCWSYFLSVLGLWILLDTAGDRWWLATVALFGPRWIWLLPLVLLIPVALALRPRLLWLLLNSSLVVIGPVMGYCVPWSSLTMPSPADFTLRVLTCNGGGEQLRVTALADLIATTRPDLVALQEGSVLNLPAGTWPDGWDVRTTVASRYPIRSIEKMGDDELGGDGFVTRFDLETPGGTVHFVNLHLETVRDGLEAVVYAKWKGAPALSDNIGLRARESEAASRWVQPVSGPIVIAGDFNMPTESTVYQRFWSSYSNAFSSAGLGFGYTKFTGWFGIRIDHVLTGPGWRCRRCWVGPDVGSDHRPVLADLEWVGTRD
jgi:endonuclease/exonuclease/phosphatase (EEP) superfamily protein YafD